MEKGSCAKRDEERVDTQVDYSSAAGTSRYHQSCIGSVLLSIRAVENELKSKYRKTAVWLQDREPYIDVELTYEYELVCRCFIMVNKRPHPTTNLCTHTISTNSLCPYI